MSTAWRWKCEVCADEFMLSLEKIPAPCRRCGGEWFLKVGENDDYAFAETGPDRPGKDPATLSGGAKAI